MLITQLSTGLLWRPGAGGLDRGGVVPTGYPEDVERHPSGAEPRSEVLQRRCPSTGTDSIVAVPGRTEGIALQDGGLDVLGRGGSSRSRDR